jgi:hypothetical protein
VIPRAPEALRMLSQRMLTQLVPDAKSTYSMSDGMLLGVLLGGLVKELEDGIARRLLDIESMKAVFRIAREALDAGELPEDIDKVIESRPPSMSMSDVNTGHDAHTRVLIALHDTVDIAAPTEAQQSVNRAIWKYLDEHAQRHALDI